MNYLRKKILILGMTATFMAGLVLLYFIWKGLMDREAIGYAKQFSHQIKERVRLIEEASKEFLTPDLYEELHKKPLARISHLTEKQPLTALLKKSRQAFDSSNLEMSLFTDCNTPNYAECYHDSDMDIVRPQFPNPLVGYDPKSRPPYLATRTHTDWVLLYFMLRGQSRISDYPPTYGIALAKHFLKNAAEERELAALTKDRKKLSHYMKNEKGLWLSFWFSVSDTRYDPFLQSIAKEKIKTFHSFDISFQNLRFPKKVLTGEGSLHVVCDATSDFTSLLSYKATVPCRINGEPIQFLFAKQHDHPLYLAGLVLFLLGLWYTAFRFFNYVEALQEQNFQRKLVSAVGAKLVHDLKKGIVTQLDHLQQEMGSDFEEEWERPDFKERLRANLNHHFFYLQILHKYMNLLSNNLRRKREENWVSLTPEQFQEYWNWILGKVPFTRQITTLPDGILFECEVTSSQILYKIPSSFAPFSVPEMAFYRILKNIWENFNAHGTGTFFLMLAKGKKGLILKTRNSISSRKPSSQESTHLGMVIIEQLLEDNFGPKAILQQEQKGNQFQLEIFLPERGHDL